MALVGSDLDVVRADGRLVLVGVVQTLDVLQVADVEGGNVVGGRQGEVGEAAILRNVGALRGSVVGSLWRGGLGDGQGGLLDGRGVAGLGAQVEQQLGDTLLAVSVLAQGVDDPDLAEMDSSGEGRTFGVAGDELDVLDAAALHVGLSVLLVTLSLKGVRGGELTFGMVIVLMMALVSRFHRRRVFARLMPRVGLRMVTGSTKSEVRMNFLSQSMLRPCGENCSPRMFNRLAGSSGHSWMMLKLASVSTRRPGEVPTAEPM